MQKPAQAAPYFHRLWKRRSVLVTGGTLFLFAATGLGTGLTIAWAQARKLLPAAGHPPVTTLARPRTATLKMTFNAHQQTVRSIAWSPDGTLLASGGDDAQVLIWKAQSGTIRQRIPQAAPVRALAWSPEGQRLVTGSGNEVTFFSTSTGSLLAQSNLHTATVTSLAWTPRGQMQIVSGALDRKAFVYESSNYQAQTIFTRHSAPIEAVAFASDGQTIGSSSSGGVIRVWNAENGAEVHGFYLDAQRPMRALAFVAEGQQLAVGGDDGIIRLWNGLVCQRQITEANDFQCEDIPIRIMASTRAIRTLAWSQRSQWLASGSDDGTIEIWDPHRLEPMLIIVGHANLPVHSLAWSPGDGLLAIASGTVASIWKLSSSP